jgi:hypothetical protein
MGKPKSAVAYLLPLACLFCWHCAKDPPAPVPCNDFVAEDSVHDYVYVSGQAPAATGGAIEDGLYDESSAEIFDPTHAAGPSGVRRSLRTVIAGQIWQAAYKGTDSSGTQAGTETYIISPAAADAGPGQLVMTRTCPADKQMTTPFGYSFSGSGPGATLQIIISGSPPLVYTMTQK